MSAITSYVSFLSGYIPAAVKDAAGLCPQISEAVRHITWISVERVFWPPQETVRFALVLGYTDGFQIWDLQDPSAVREIVSKQDKAILQARLLPTPLTPLEGSGEQPLGVAAAPLLAYLHRGAPALVRMFSLRLHDDVHLVRLTEPARSLQASRRFFAVGLTRQVELYDALNFQSLFSVQCNAAAGPTFALGQRWLAYNLPPQQPAGTVGSAGGLLAGHPRQLPTMVRDGLQYLGQVGQRTLDNVLMPPPEGADQVTRGGIVAVRDAATRAVIAQFEDHAEPIETMAWDPSGLQLVTCAALGHRVLIHRALLGTEHALVMNDSVEGGIERGSVVFQHVFTLSRGYTPAVISDIAMSDDGQFVAVSSAKGTTHVFRLPPLHSAALGHRSLETGSRLGPHSCASLSPSDMGIGLSLGSGMTATKPVHLTACTRIRLGSVLLQEGLMPQCGFIGSTQQSSGSRVPGSRDALPRMYVATRAGTLALYSINTGPSTRPSQRPTSGSNSFSGGDPASGGGAASDGNEWQAVLARELHACRPFRHFTERRLSPHDYGAAPRGRTGSVSGPAHERDARAASPSAAAAMETGGSATRAPAAWASPTLAPQASPTLGPRPSPLVGGAASPSLGPTARTPPLSGRTSSPQTSRSLLEDTSVNAGTGTPGRGGAEPSKWLSSVETATHVPAEVPLWFCPQLTFHTYPSTTSRSELNAILRSGRQVPGCKRVAITRPERPGHSVHCDGAASPRSEERLSKLLGGALGSTMDDARGGINSQDHDSAVGRGATARPRVLVAPAWGALAATNLTDEVGNGGLLQADGIGAGLAEVEEGWLDLERERL